MERLMRVVREELAKAGGSLVAIYELARDMDARTMEILVALLGKSK